MRELSVKEVNAVSGGAPARKRKPKDDFMKTFLTAFGELVGALTKSISDGFAGLMKILGAGRTA